MAWLGFAILNCNKAIYLKQIFFVDVSSSKPWEKVALRDPEIDGTQLEDGTCPWLLTTFPDFNFP